MAKVLELESGKAGVLQQLQCLICYDNAEQARLCPHCSQIFCNKCIIKWLTNETSVCPYCRYVVYYSELVKGYSITKLQESIKQLFFSIDRQRFHDDQMCDKHVNQQLSLFCHPCETSICVKCLFSKDHAEHKEHAVPLEEAFDYFKQAFSANLTWVNDRKKVVNQVLSQVQQNERELRKEKQLIDSTICEIPEVLGTVKASPASIMQILQTNRNMAELRSEHQDDPVSIRLARRREFISEPTVLIFRLTEFDNTVKDRGSCETKLEAPYGFEWKCKIADVNGSLFFYLCLIGGKPSEYSVQFGNEPEKVYLFERDTAVKIGVYEPDPNVDNTHQLTVYVRHSYVDRIQQLEEHIARLEKKNDEYVAFKMYLAAWDKRNGPSSG